MSHPDFESSSVSGGHTASQQRRTESVAVRASGDSVFSSIVSLIVCVGVPLLVGFAGSQATSGNVDGWYAQADRAPWTPPNEVFGPVWSVLYVVMGLASWLVWRRRRDLGARSALWAYVIQLVLNGLWTPAFFGLYPVWGSAALWVAFAIIVALIVVVVATIRLFGRVFRVAAWLLVPYVGWLAYASTLNVYAALNN
jgi:benzodiazapine receptor